MTYVLLNEDLYAVFSWAINIPLIIALINNTYPGSKMERTLQTEYCRYAIATVGRALVVVAAYMHSVTSYDSLYCCILIRTGTMAGRYGSSCGKLF